MASTKTEILTGDEIVEQLVEWTKMLPFYCELPVEVHTHLLTQRWAELVRNPVRNLIRSM